MPADFDRCVAEGGDVRTIKPKTGRYLHVCYKDGKSYSGEVHTNKEQKIVSVRAKVSEIAKKK